MSLDKAIEHGKEKRKPYKGAKAIDRTCRNHGSCEWCKGNRTYSKKKAELISDWDNQEMCSPLEDDGDIDWFDANVDDVTLDGEPLDGHYFDRMIDDLWD